MDITKEQIDELNATINIKLTTEDIEPRVNESLSKIRKTAQLKGFRPGKAPMGLIKKMYGQATMYEELNKLVNESLTSYISDEKLDLLGEPMMSENQANDEDRNDEEYNFSFDIGLKPQFELDLENDVELPYYEIKVEDKAINDYIDHYANQFGKIESCDEIIESAFIKADITELDKENNPLDDGIKTENTLISIDTIENKDVQKEIIGLKVGDKKIVDIKDVLSNDTDIASALGIDKEKVSELNSKFELTIKEITNFVKSELNEEFFEKVFPDGEINNEEEFRAKIKEIIESYKKQDSDYKLFTDAREYLLEKTNLQLPEEFLKRWLKTKNDGEESDEEHERKLDEEFPDLLRHFRWQILLQRIIKDKEITVERSEIEKLAMEQLRAQLVQYGMVANTIKDEQLKQFATESILSKKEEVEKLYEQQYELKALKAVKEAAKLNPQEISEEEFKAFFEKKEETEIED